MSDDTPRTDALAIKHNKFGDYPWAELCRQLELELAAAQATINSIMPQPCCEKFETCGNDRCVPLLKAKLARYENAEMPEEPRRFGYTPDKSGRRTGLHVVWADDYDKLCTFAAAQTVRADENERYRKDALMDIAQIYGLLSEGRADAASDYCRSAAENYAPLKSTTALAAGKGGG